MQTIPANPIVLFDGVCNLCNSFVQFIIKRDKKKQFLFASLQSSRGQKLLKQHNLPTGFIDSFVLIHNDKAYTKSGGALQVAKLLGGFYSIFHVFIIVPRFIRDAVYNLIGRNRYKWFGKRESCTIPTLELKARFLND